MSVRNSCSGLLLGVLVLVLVLLSLPSVAQIPMALGDLDADRVPTVLDLQRLLNHLNAGTNASSPGLLASSLVPYTDINEDGIVNTNDVRLLQDAILGRSVLPNPYAVPIVNVSAMATNGDIITITGTARPNRRIMITGGQLVVFANSGSNGQFTAQVRLRRNQVNAIFVSATNSTFTAGIPQPLRVLQDSQPPNVFIDFPTNGTVLYSESTVIAGRVGDSLSGFAGLNVRVRAVESQLEFPAVVDVGIGNNGTYERSNVPLVEGTNIIRVTAADVHGNTTNREITLVRRPLVGPRLLVISGDGQKTNVHRRLSDPIIVKATQADGVTPLANTLVTFEVTRSDGRLQPLTPSALADLAAFTNDINRTPFGVPRVTLRTDAAGTARVWWALGGDAGCGNNRVCVMSAGISNAAYFCASADAAPPKQINIGTGNNQKAETGGFLPEPLRAWVNDSCNGNEGLPVTFTVVQGGGKLFPLSTINSQPSTQDGSATLTVPATRTGHAEVLLQLGPDAGQNIVEANYPGNPNLPATFIAYGVARDPGKPTTLTGLLLDNTSQPIGGATCRLSVGGRSFTNTTDVQGRFNFGQLGATNTEPETIPSGPAQLRVDGTTGNTLLGVTIPTNSYPSLEFQLILIPNAENSLPMPVLLPRLNLANQRLYYGTNDLVLTCEGMEGLKMTIKAGSMKKPDGTLVTPSNPSYVSLNQVHHDNVPMPIPDGASPPFAWTLQPGGATFDPPVQVEYPNMSGLPAGTIAYFLSYNHDTRRFEIICSGHVREDSATIVSDPGAGLTIAGWGCNCPLYAVSGDCRKCQPKQNGCGSDGLSSLVPDCWTFIPGELPVPWLNTFTALSVCFEGSCNIHDVCWGSCPGALGDAHQAACDAQFLNNLRNSCDSLPLFAVDARLKCEALAWAYYAAVSIDAVKAYKESQQDLNLNDCCGASLASLSPLLVAANGGVSPIRPPFADDDFDGIDDGWELANGMNPRDPSDGHLDLDADGLSNLLEFVYSTKPRDPDSDDDGVTDGAQIQRLSRPSPPTLDSQWTVSVGGQSAIVGPSGTVRVRNISAPDEFDNTLGPGTRPDFLSDDFVRLTGQRTSNRTNLYVFSEFFQIRQGGVISITNLTFTSVPPRKPDSLTIIRERLVMTAIGETNRLRVIARYPDGTTNDVTARTSWTSYRLSNPSIASIDGDGRLVAKARGSVFVTAVNEGATAVSRIDVSPGDALTMLIGAVVTSDGAPSSGGEVILIGVAGTAVTGLDGRFEISDVATAFGIQGVAAIARPPNFAFGVVTNLTLVPGGITDVGIIRLDGSCISCSDQDRDGLPDSIEVTLGTDINRADTDRDGLSDRVELAVTITSPLVNDTDGDGLSDEREDPDLDGLNNADEITRGTNPLLSDSDADGWPDESEVTGGSDPVASSSTPILAMMSRPSVAILLPALSDPTLITNTFMAQPPVRALLPSLGASSVPVNTVIARPQIQAVIPSFSDLYLSPNTTISRPPVKVGFEPQ